MLLNYYVHCVDALMQGEQIYVSPPTKMQILHVYSLPASIYTLSYFCNLTLSSTNVLKILMCILLEKQIVFVSGNCNLMVSQIETLLQLLSPLKW